MNLTTKHTPSQIVYGRNTLQGHATSLDLQPPALTGSLIDASLATDVAKLREALDTIWEETRENIDHIRRKQEERYNKTKKHPNFQEGDLVFIIDHRLPVSGTSRKLEPSLQKSPFLITKLFSHVCDVTRLTDRWSTRVHVNDQC